MVDHITVSTAAFDASSLSPKACIENARKRSKIGIGRILPGSASAPEIKSIPLTLSCPYCTGPHVEHNRHSAVLSCAIRNTDSSHSALIIGVDPRASQSWVSRINHGILILRLLQSEACL